MTKRFRDAVYIQEGACNPSGICHSILEACKEIRDGGGGTRDICTDPAVRLMVHQLQYLTNNSEIERELGTYSYLLEDCRKRAGLILVEQTPVWGSQQWAETRGDDLGESPDY